MLNGKVGCRLLALRDRHRRIEFTVGIWVPDVHGRTTSTASVVDDPNRQLEAAFAAVHGPDLLFFL